VVVVVSCVPIKVKRATERNRITSADGSAHRRAADQIKNF
jgi:hypothetical protein